MAAVTITEARANLAETVNRVAYAGERITLKRAGKAMAAIVSVDDLALLETLEDKLDIADAQKARKQRERIPWKAVKAKLGL